MPLYEPRNSKKTLYKPILDAEGFDWNLYLRQMCITAYMDDLSADSDEEI